MLDSQTTLVIKVPLHTWTQGAQQAFDTIVGVPGKAVTNVFTGDAEISYPLSEHAEGVNLVHKLQLGEVQIGQSYEVNTVADFEQLRLLGKVETSEETSDEVDDEGPPPQALLDLMRGAPSDDPPAAPEPVAEAEKTEAPATTKKAKKK